MLLQQVLQMARKGLKNALLYRMQLFGYLQILASPLIQLPSLSLLAQQDIAMGFGRAEAFPYGHEIWFHVKHQPIEQFSATFRAASNQLLCSRMQGNARQLASNTQMMFLSHRIETSLPLPFFPLHAGLVAFSIRSGPAGLQQKTSMPLLHAVTQLTVAKTLATGQYMHGFQQAGFSRAIGPIKKIEPREELNFLCLQIAKPLQMQMVQMHGSELERHDHMLLAVIFRILDQTRGHCIPKTNLYLL